LADQDRCAVFVLIQRFWPSLLLGGAVQGVGAAMAWIEGRFDS